MKTTKFDVKIYDIAHYYSVKLKDLMEKAHIKRYYMAGGCFQKTVHDIDLFPVNPNDFDGIKDDLKELAEDRLVIMVTHNPELAENYSTRIISLVDGEIVNDTNPYEGVEEKPDNKKLKKTSMSFFTALSLSLKNLLTKKTRTLLVAFAGSIGIIGIALILSLSSGVRNYIKRVEEDTLSSYPLTITAETADTTSMLLSMVPGESEEGKDSVVKENNKILCRMVLN